MIANDNPEGQEVPSVQQNVQAAFDALEITHPRLTQAEAPNALYRQDSQISSLVGKGVFLPTPISSLPMRYTAHSFLTGQKTYLYAVLPDNTFTNGQTLIETLIKAANESLRASVTYLREDSDLVVDKLYVNPDRVGFPYQDISDQSTQNRDITEILKTWFTLVPIPGSRGKCSECNTFDDPAIAAGRAFLRAFSRDSMGPRIAQLTNRMNAMQESLFIGGRHVRALGELEYASPVMDHTVIKNFFARIHAPAELVANYTFDLAQISMRVRPISSYSLIITTATSATSLSALTPFSNLSPTSTFITDLTWYLKSLLTPGMVLLNIDFSDVETACVRQTYAVLCHLICMFSEDNMYTNITRDTKDAIDSMTNLLALTKNPRPIQAPSKELQYMNSFTPDIPNDVDPFRVHYPSCVTRKNLFIDSSDITRADMAQEALNASVPIVSFNDTAKRCFAERRLCPLLSQLQIDLANFFLQWNATTKVVWYNGLRIDAGSFEVPYSEYTNEAYVHTISIRNMMYILKILNKDALVCDPSRDVSLHVEIGLAEECSRVYFIYNMIKQLTAEFDLQAIYTDSEVKKMALSTQPFLMELYARLHLVGRASSMDAIFSRMFIDEQFEAFFLPHYTFTEERLLHHGVIKEIILNEYGFRLRSSDIRQLILEERPYRNVTPRENDDYVGEVTFRSLCVKSRNAEFKFFLNEREIPYRLRGFFPLRVSATIPSGLDVCPLSFLPRTTPGFAFTNLMRVTPVTAFTRVFENKDFPTMDDFVIGNSNSIFISIPSRQHKTLVIMLDAFFSAGRRFPSARQEVIGAPAFSYINLFDLWV